MKRALTLTAVLGMAFLLVAPLPDAQARGGRGKGFHGHRDMMQPGPEEPGMGGDMGGGMGPMAGPRALDIDLGLFNDDGVKDAFDGLMAQALYDALKLDDGQKKLFKSELDKTRMLRKDADALLDKYGKKMVPLLKTAAKDQKDKGAVSDETAKQMASLRRMYHDEARTLIDKSMAITSALWDSLRMGQVKAMHEAGMAMKLKMWEPEDDDVSMLACAFVDRLRMMPDSRFNDMKKGFSNRPGQAAGLDRDKLSEFFGLVEKLRGLSSEEYEVQREKLASSLDPLILDMVSHRQMNRPGVAPCANPGCPMALGQGRPDVAPCANPGCPMALGQGAPNAGPGMGAGPGAGMDMKAMRHHKKARFFWKTVSSDAFYALLK